MNLLSLKVTAQSSCPNVFIGHPLGGKLVDSRLKRAGMTMNKALQLPLKNMFLKLNWVGFSPQEGGFGELPPCPLVCGTFSFFKKQALS